MTLNIRPSHAKGELSLICRLRFVKFERYQHACLVKTCQEVVKPIRAVFTKYVTFCFSRMDFVALMQQASRASAEARYPAQTRHGAQRFDLIGFLDRRLENAEETSNAGGPAGGH
jgi:hypothetical protein